MFYNERNIPDLKYDHIFKESRGMINWNKTVDTKNLVPSLSILDTY